MMDGILLVRQRGSAVRVPNQRSASRWAGSRKSCHGGEKPRPLVHSPKPPQVRNRNGNKGRTGCIRGIGHHHDRGQRRGWSGRSEPTTGQRPKPRRRPTSTLAAPDFLDLPIPKFSYLQTIGCRFRCQSRAGNHFTMTTFTASDQPSPVTRKKYVPDGLVEPAAFRPSHRKVFWPPSSWALAASVTTRRP